MDRCRLQGKLGDALCAVCGGIQSALAEEGSTPLGAKGYFVALCVDSVDQPLTRKTTIYLRSLLIYACHC